MMDLKLRDVETRPPATLKKRAWPDLAACDFEVVLLYHSRAPTGRKGMQMRRQTMERSK